MRSRSDGAYFEMRVPEIIKPLFEKYASVPGTARLPSMSVRKAKVSNHDTGFSVNYP